MLIDPFEKKRPSLLLLGFIAASSLTLTAFEWRTPIDQLTVYDPIPTEEFKIESDLLHIQIEYKQPDVVVAKVPLTQQRSSSSQIQTVPDNMPMMTMTKSSAAVAKPLVTKHTKSLPASLSTPSPSGPVDMRSLSVHELPYMTDCSSITDDVERFQCTQNSLKKFIANEFKIPSIDRLRDLPGRLVVEFVIDEHGVIRQIDPGKECAPALRDEIERVFASIPTMVAAASGGKRVPVRFSIPLRVERY